MVSRAIIFLLLVACAGPQSANKVSSGRVSFEGGVAKDKSWDETLEFSRLSWYRGLTLYYDISMAELSAATPFRNWISESEKSTFKGCRSTFVSFLYSFDSKILSVAGIKEGLKKQGLEELEAPGLKNALRSHQSYSDSRLGQHRISIWCSKIGLKSRYIFDFPGYLRREMKVPSA